MAACAPADLDALMECKYNGTDLTVTQAAAGDGTGHRREHQGRRFARFCADCISVPYIHAGGKIGVLVNLGRGRAPASMPPRSAKDLAMQIAALNPRFLDKAQVTQEVLDEEKKILMAQMDNRFPRWPPRPARQGEDRGRRQLNKFYAENCLLSRLRERQRSPW